MIGANNILRDKLDESLLAHFDALKQQEQVSVGDLYGMQFLCETHFYMKVEHEYTPADVEALLQFKDPLDVAMRAREENTRDYTFPVADVLREMGAHELFPLADKPEKSEPKRSASVRDRLQTAVQELKEKPAPEAKSRGDDLHHDPDTGLSRLPELMDKLDTEMARLKIDWLALDAETLIGMAADIDATSECYKTFRNYYADYDGALVEHLLKFQQPLAVLTSHWSRNDGDEICCMVDYLLLDSEVDLHKYALVTDTTATDQKLEKVEQNQAASVRDRLQAAVKELKEKPAPDGKPRDDGAR